MTTQLQLALDEEPPACTAIRITNHRHRPGGKLHSCQLDADHPGKHTAHDLTWADWTYQPPRSVPR